MIAPDVSLGTRVWDVEEFAAAKDEWDGLLALSDADPLFMSWDWQWRWWRHHGTALGAQLQVLGIYSGPKLVGLAPFYVRRVVVRRLLRPRRMELIGTAWRDSAAAFSDYLDIIATRECRGAVLAAVARWLKTADWDELALCCTRQQGTASELATRYLPDIARVRQVDPMTGWCARLPDRFEQYVGSLGPEVRRRLYNQRRKLTGAEICPAGEADIPGFLELLWCFAGERWDGVGPSAHARGFFMDIAGHMARTGQLRLTALLAEDRPISVMFNLRVGKGLVYLQSGFDVSRSRGISPGYLHFGYAIEAACGEGVRSLDFLAGSGRHRDYKRELCTDPVPVVTYHAVRGPLARMLYAGHDLLLKCRDSLHSRWAPDRHAHQAHSRSSDKSGILRKRVAGSETMDL